MLIKGEYSVKQFNPKVLLSPALIAAAVAALLVALGVHTPDVIARPVTMVGNVTGVCRADDYRKQYGEAAPQGDYRQPEGLRGFGAPPGGGSLSLYFFFKVCGVTW